MAFKVSLYLNNDEAIELKSVINESNLSSYHKEFYCASIHEGLVNYQIKDSRERIIKLANELNTSSVNQDNMLSIIALEDQIEILKNLLT